MNLDTKNKNITVWIGKMPKYITNAILESKTILNIGKIIIDKQEETNKVNLKINFSKEINKLDIPIDHIVEIKDKNVKLYLIKNNEDKLSIEGIVNKECLIKPVINSKYLEYKKNKIENENSKKSSVKFFNHFIELKKGERYGSLKEVELLARKRKMMLQDKKRERLDSKDVLDMIFNAFERREYWIVKDLADFTGQPVSYIQELIGGICVLNKTDHKNFYELKPEYKQQK